MQAMTITFDVPIKNTEHEYEEIKVEFEGEPTWEDNSYSDEFGLVKVPPYASMARFGNPKWDKTQYTPEQNKNITEWYETHWQYVDFKFCREFEIESNSK